MNEDDAPSPPGAGLWTILIVLFVLGLGGLLLALELRWITSQQCSAWGFGYCVLAGGLGSALLARPNAASAKATWVRETGDRGVLASWVGTVGTLTGGLAVILVLLFTGTLRPLESAGLTLMFCGVLAPLGTYVLARQERRLAEREAERVETRRNMLARLVRRLKQGRLESDGFEQRARGRFRKRQVALTVRVAGAGLFQQHDTTRYQVLLKREDPDLWFVRVGGSPPFEARSPLDALDRQALWDALVPVFRDLGGLEVWIEDGLLEAVFPTREEALNYDDVEGTLKVLNELAIAYERRL